MKKQKLLSIVLLALLCTLPVKSIAQSNYNELIDQQSTASDLPLEEIKMFVDVYMQIKNRYVDEISDKELIDKAINGMISGLDPYSEYLGKTSYNKLTSDTIGQFGGVGVNISLASGGVRVISPINNSPATDVDIRGGDLIVKIGKVKTKGLKLQKIESLMHGKPGTKLDLVIERKGSDKLLTKTIIRDVIQLETISSEWLTDEVAYIRLSQFQSASAAEMRDKILNFQNDETKNFKGLIFDLRDNPGGLLTSAVSVSDIFLNGGKIVSTKDRSNNLSEEFVASPKDLTNGVPLVVLVDKGSASASEIVSGALQDNGRAKIIGTKSFGKGSVQSLINLSDARALKLTTGEYFTPSGRSIHEKGITPDIKVSYTSVNGKNSAGGISKLNRDSQIMAGIKYINSSL